MLLAVTTRRMVRSAHLPLSLIRFTEQFDFAVLDRYSYEKMHTSSLVRRDGLISALVTTSMMWWLVLRWAHLTFPTMLYAYIMCHGNMLSASITCYGPIITCCQPLWRVMGYSNMLSASRTCYGYVVSLCSVLWATVTCCQPLERAMGHGNMLSPSMTCYGPWQYGVSLCNVLWAMVTCCQPICSSYGPW